MSVIEHVRAARACARKVTLRAHTPGGDDHGDGAGDDGGLTFSS